MKEFSSDALLVAFGISSGLVVSILLSLLARRFPRSLLLGGGGLTAAVLFHDFELTNWPFLAGFTYSLIGGLWFFFLVWAFLYRGRRGLWKADMGGGGEPKAGDTDDDDADDE